MARSSADLAVRARRAYELGRLRAKLPAALFAVPPAVVALDICGRPWLTVPLAGLLAVALVAAHWRGEAAARGATAGLMAGALAFAVPILVNGMGLCQQLPSLAFVLVCGGGGLASGGVLAARALRHDGPRALFLISGGLIAGLTGGLGCALAGLGGLAGVAAGVCLGLAPAALARSDA